MGFEIHTHVQPGVKGLDPTLYVLDDGAGTKATLWPALGFNCLSWQVPDASGVLDLLYTDPAVFDNGRPTRSGIPVLFPFPNRIRDGRFSWDGKVYQLPLNDPSKRNAIHGFACRHPWPVVGQGTDATRAWLTGEFQGSLDAPECVPLWPADYLIRLTYQLSAGELCVLAEVVNPDRQLLPFGLGFHPYFRLPFGPVEGSPPVAALATGEPPVATARAEDCEVQVKAPSYWVLQDSLPTGEREPVDAARDLNTPRRCADLQVDDVLTDLVNFAAPPAAARRAPARVIPHGSESVTFCHPVDQRRPRAVIWGLPNRPLRLFCSGSFRDLVIFTPPHRQAFCVEPYTCTTDAVNLQARGVEAGWMALEPGDRWRGAVWLQI